MKRTQGRRIMEWFQCNRGWQNASVLLQVFGGLGFYHIGINYGRRMRELRESGILESKRDPRYRDGTHCWRLAGK